MEEFKVGDLVIVQSLEMRKSFDFIEHKPYLVLEASTNLVIIKNEQSVCIYVEKEYLEKVADRVYIDPLPQKSVGIKHDQEKPLMSSIPKEAMWEMGLALGYGAKKYGVSNFRNGILVSRQLAAAVRHIYQHLDGENNDPESGVSHLGHALASLAMACYTLKNHKNLDDRFVGDLEKHNKGEGNNGI